MSSRFVHLHTHSHYSLLSALPRIDELVDEAKNMGMNALALTDNSSMYGAIDFYKACKKKEINPILGVDFYLAARTRKDMAAGIDNRRFRLVLLAQNEAGYKNLLKLVTISNFEGFYYKPRIDRELIEKYSDNLICIIPSFAGEITQALKGRTQEKAEEIAAFYKKVFNGRLYIEITRHPEINGHEESMKTLVTFAKKNKVPIMAAHDVYYMKPEDRMARETLVRVNSHMDGTDRISESDEDDFSFISPERAEELFRDIPEALDNTRKIADSCKLELTLGKWVFPNYVVESGRSYDDELKHLVDIGYEFRGIAKTPEIVARAEYELEVIKKKGYAPYFLVVSDLMRYAHEHKILTTIRGSVAGSLVTYLANITNVNPIEYKLPFERFLNPDRPSAPDIDMDYADNRRDEMIEYAKKKYGAENVAQIGTFGTMMARGSVRDVSRALGYSFDDGDRIAKLIPMGSQGFPMTIEKALEITPELKKMYDDEPDVKRIIDLARKIEGCARHISVHAAGVVIAPKPLIEYTPLQFDPKGEGKIITQYDMYGITDEYGGVGILKFDFLGIRNLSILADAVERVKKIENIDVDIENVPVDDKKTFEMLARGETIGLFQLNGSGMTRFLIDLKPSVIHDINAMVALYRPGPMETIPQYIERKHDPSKVKYLDPRLKDILDQSYGVITYQDDVMMTAIKLAGYSWTEADKLRKAMGKKIPAEMQEQKEKLLKGFVANGLSAKKAQELWKLIEPFAAYGFNKAHAASYGKVAYQTSYMKANFPEIYMSAVLTAESGDIETIGEIVTECRRMGVPVLPPDINESFSQFTVVKTEVKPYRIRFGLVTIKNFGQGISSAIIDERKRGGKFKSLADFLSRVRDRNLNKKSLEALIKSGALDCFGEDRGIMVANIDLLLAFNKEHGNTHTDQDNLFGLMSDNSSVPTLKLANAPKSELIEKLGWEKELLGLYVSGHPLERYREVMEKKDIDIKRAKENGKEGTSYVLATIVNAVRTVQTKNNETMAFLTISDFSGSSDAVVFPRTYREFRELINPDACLAIKATLNERNGEKSFVIERMKRL